ncbi:MAG: F0F1 ATP synthase subunit B [Saprospiraceae bacterium]|nr:F0F1 ATP synthase subunit B [Saprospiraceae bacterium]
MSLLYIVSWVEFSPIKPEVGLLFWSTVVFAIFWLIIGKLAFKPIIRALNDRSNTIQDSLDAAKIAKEEMKNLRSENDRIMAEAREEKMRIIKEAKDAANLIVSDAKDRAKEEAQRITINAKNEIENAKMAALVDVKNQLGAMATDIAEKIIRKNLSNDTSHQEYVKKLVDEVKMN